MSEGVSRGPAGAVLAQVDRAIRASGSLLPVLVTGLFTAYSLHRSEVATRDLMVFAAYLLFGLVLPGTVLWRMLVSGGRGPLLVDLALGTSLAYAAELGSYLLCAHFDAPGAAFVWPVIPLLASLLPAARKRVWRRAGEPSPVWVAWVLAAAICFSVSLQTRMYFDSFQLTPRALRSPYVDIPFHLSLIGALSRHVPVDLPAVDGQPLYYHWFVHADLAAARHATGIEPLILLMRLGPLAFMTVVIIGVAALARRVSGSWFAGALAAVLLAFTSGAALSRNFGPLFNSGYIFLSPTTTFAMCLLIACAAASYLLLRPRATDPDAAPGAVPVARPRYGLWFVAALTLGAISGAKGSLLPIVLAGYVAVVLMGLVLTRRLHRSGLGLLAIGTFWFLLAQKYIYGGSSQGTVLHPFGIGKRIVESLDLAPVGHASVALAGAATALYLVSRLTIWSGVVGLFTRDGWRDPRNHFAVAAVLAAVGAVVVFDSAAFNQVYFLLVAPPLIAVSSACGFELLSRRLPTAVTWKVLAAATAFGIGIGYLALYVNRNVTHYSTARLFVPPLVVLLACVAAALVVGRFLVSRDLGTDGRRAAGLLAFAGAVAALSLPLTLNTGASMLTSPQNQYRWIPRLVQPAIGAKGINAARWLRDHSSVDDVVATNSHCLYPAPRACDHRSTWIAAYAERQVLVEGWSYSSRSGADSAAQHVPVSRIAFWQPDQLADNDLAFSDPTPARLARLHDHYGVTWLFVDRRFPANLTALRALAIQRHQVGQYVVFQLS